MRTIYIIGVSIIFVTLGLSVYVHYDTKKFEESLPSVKEVPVTAENDALPLVTKSMGTGETASEQATPHHHHPGRSEDTGESTSEGTGGKPPEETSVTTHFADSPQSPATGTASKKRGKNIHYADLPIDGKIAKLRHALVNLHGNIPEIEEFLSLKKKQMTSRVYLPNNLSVLDMPIEEEIRLAELAVQLYPMFPGNQKVLASVLERKARQDSGQVLPITAFPPEVWQEIAMKARVIVDSK